MTSATTNPVWADVRTADVRDVKLAYREAGQGEPVVFVHGGLSDLRTWNPQLAGLSDAYRTIALSRRYARPNDDIPPDADDPLVPHADDLAAFVQAVGAAPAHLVGNSWGAFVCLVTAVRHPQVVRSLVLEEPPVIPLFLGAGFPPLSRQAVASVTVPVLLLQGAESRAFFGAVTYILADLLPHARRVVIPAATHVMHEQSPDAVNAALREFLRGQR